MGAATNSSRTGEQTDLALFWYSNYLILWYQTLRAIATAHLSSIDDSARLFALVSLAMGDAAITAWDTKLHYAFWRPHTAIHEADNDGNPETSSDPNWKPLANNPNYPDYTSGANNLTGAITGMLELFFGTDEMTFTVTTTYALANPQMPTLTFHCFSDAANDVLNARVWEGIHFRFADVQGRKQGRHVAQWVFSHFLRSVDADETDEHEDEGAGE
jgi:PAP2 superfamily